MTDSSKTKVNEGSLFERINKSRVTQVNSNNSQTNVPLLTGMTLQGGYNVVQKLSNSGGEADIYIAHDNDGKQYIVKIYRRKNAIKKETVEKLSAIDSPFIGKITTLGDVQGFKYTVVPFYEGISVADSIKQGYIFTLDDIKKTFLPPINEAINTLHKAGIYHRDIKPSNIIILSSTGNPILIDFGISSVTNGQTVVNTLPGLSALYAAPETTMSGLFLKESDYYSLGVTIYEMVVGYHPFTRETIFEDDEITRLSVLNNIKYPDTLPEDLRDLIRGLTYADIRNRNDLKNPNRRWIYDDVKLWIKGEKRFITNQSEKNIADSDREFKVPFKYKGREIFNNYDLITTMLADWEYGKTQLMRGILARHYKVNGLNEKYLFCQKIEKMIEVAQISETDDLFYKYINQLEPNIKNIYWKGLFFENISKFGEELVDFAYRNDKNLSLLVDFTKLSLSEHINQCSIYERNRGKILQIIENCKNIINVKKGDYVKNTAFCIGYAISNLKKVFIGNKLYESEDIYIDEITSQLKTNGLKGSVKLSKDIESIKYITSICGFRFAKLTNFISSVLFLPRIRFYVSNFRFLLAFFKRFDLDKIYTELLREGNSVYSFDDFQKKLKEDIKEIFDISSKENKTELIKTFPFLDRLNPVLNSPDDINDEVLRGIINNEIETITINYNFTRRRNEGESLQQYDSFRLKYNPFFKANRQKELYEIKPKIILTDNVTSLACAFMGFDKLTRVNIYSLNQVSDMGWCFAYDINFNQSLKYLDFFKVKNIEFIFFKCRIYNSDFLECNFNKRINNYNAVSYTYFSKYNKAFNKFLSFRSVYNEFLDSVEQIVILIFKIISVLFLFLVCLFIYDQKPKLFKFIIWIFLDGLIIYLIIKGLSYLVEFVVRKIQDFLNKYLGVIIFAVIIILMFAFKK